MQYRYDCTQLVECNTIQIQLPAVATQAIVFGPSLRHISLRAPRTRGPALPPCVLCVCVLQISEKHLTDVNMWETNAISPNWALSKSANWQIFCKLLPAPRFWGLTFCLFVIVLHELDLLWELPDYIFNLTIKTIGNQCQSLKKLMSDLPYACECTWPIGSSIYTPVKSYEKPRFLLIWAS